MPIKSVAGGWARPVEAKTASYTVLPSDSGKMFTNRGASGSITLTLPTSGSYLNGWSIDVFVIASQTIVIATATADTLAAHNDLAYDSVTLPATPGQHARVFHDGTQFCVIPNPTAATTATAVTAWTLTT